MLVFGLTGFSGSGKTELLLKLISHYRGMGLRVSAIKHAHHGFDVDSRGKDSYRYRERGACEVMVSSSRRWALLHENLEDEGEAELSSLLGYMCEVDLVLVEGYKQVSIPKLEVWRQACDSSALALGGGEGSGEAVPPNIMAIASPLAEHGLLSDSCSQRGLSLLALEDIEVIADYVREHAILREGVPR